MMPLLRADVEVALARAIDRPEAGFSNDSWSPRELGRQAKMALAENNTRQLLAFLRAAADGEVAAASGTAFADALDLALRWIDQLVAERPCAECSAVRGRRCAVKSARGGDMLREWVHASRIVVEVVA
jgi:hypothetical protein